METPSNRQSGTTDKVESFCCLLPECGRALHENDRHQKRGLTFAHHSGTGTTAFEYEETSGDQGKVTGGSGTNGSIRTSAENET